MLRVAQTIALTALSLSVLGCGLDPLARPDLGGGSSIIGGGENVISTPAEQTVASMSRPASWASLPSPPTDASDCRAHWNGHEVLLWSGLSGDCSGHIFSRSGQWQPMSTAGRPELARWWAGAAGEHLVVYGYNDNEHYAFRYDPADDSWSDTAPIAMGTAPEQMIALSTESKMILWGGFDTPPGEDISMPRFSKYDPMVDEWAPLTEYEMVTPRYAHGTVWDTHHMFVFGGYDYNGQMLGDAGLYDEGSDSWETIIPTGAPSPRLHAAIAWTGFVYVIFGGTVDGTTFLGDGGQYCPEPCWAWGPVTTPEPVFAPRHPKAFWTGEHVIVMQTTDAPLQMARYWAVRDVWDPIEVPAALDDFVVVDAHWDWEAYRALLWGRHADGTMKLWAYYPPFKLAPNGSHPGNDLDGNQKGI